MLNQRIWLWLSFALLVAVVVEGGAAAILRLPNLGSFVWSPDLEQARHNWNSLASGADEEIGGFRASGAKFNSEFADVVHSCGSAYGDSYVFGNDVAAADGWVEQLSHLLGCRVGNYAVVNYGTDQAYLRFHQVNDQAPLVLLGLNPNTIMDNVNQYDGFLGAPLEPAALKGRFVLDAFGHLDWLDRPRLDADGFVAMHRNPAGTLPRTYFLPDTSDGPITITFPYAASLVRVALMPRLHELLAGRTEWSGMYAADHPAGGLQLMAAICEAFVDLARSRGQRTLIVMLPLASSFGEKANYGEFEYAPLVAALAAKGIEVFDPGAAMLGDLGGRTYCEFYARPPISQQSSPIDVRHYATVVKSWLRLRCGGHYSKFGNTTMSKLVAAEVRRRDLLKH
jgi:hypothetical protein